jgi:hypothetical protein
VSIIERKLNRFSTCNIKSLLRWYFGGKVLHKIEEKYIYGDFAQKKMGLVSIFRCKPISFATKFKGSAFFHFLISKFPLTDRPVLSLWQKYLMIHERVQVEHTYLEELLVGP